MAEVCPFPGVHYNQSRIDDWAKVICPPYDIITPQQQQELYQSSEYNFVRLEFGRKLPQDTAIDNKYTRAAATLEQWLRQGIFEVDTIPALYLHDHYFQYQGKEYKRRGLIAHVRLEEWDKMIIRPHEGTLAEPKSDRLSLLWALQANTSPILALFEDEKQGLSSVFSTQERNKPVINSSSAGGERHKVWAITEPGAISQICRSLAQQPLYIADGHHRYESALSYQHERRACASSLSGDEPFNFVLMTLVDFADPGLVILPPHRLVRGIAKSTLKELMPELKTFFEIEELPLSAPALWRQVDEFFARSSTVRLALFAQGAERLSLLQLRDSTTVSQMMPYFHSELYKKLDVSVVDHVILEKLLGLSTYQENSLLAYSYERGEAVNRVLAQEYQFAFLLRPIKADVIKAVADVGDRMPRKSTYFYPKLPAGLIFNRLV